MGLVRPSRTVRVILFLIVFCLVAIPAQAQYSGGTGEADDPYQIATAADLIALGETPDDYDKHFILTADIDLGPNLPGRKVFHGAVIAPDTDDSEDWFQGTPFVGVLDGSGHTVSHMTMVGKDFLGLFGELSGEIRNLSVSDVNIVASGDRVGGLAGSNNGSVTNCYSTGAVRGEDSVGGLVGSNNGSITGSHSIVTVCGTDAVAGLVGSSTYKLYGPPLSTISDCSSASTVTGDTCVGGLAGGNTGSVVTSYSTGAVTGREQVGGLVGDNWFNRFLSLTPASIADCYSTGTVPGDISVGGLVGSNRSASITASYSSGAVSGDHNVGGLVGADENGELIQDFWDIEISGQTVSSGGTGLTTAEMQTAGTFLEAGWDFVDETENGTEDIWWILEGQDYPRLWWELIPEN